MTQRKKWSELTTGQRMAGTFGAVLQITLLAAALWDIWHRPADEIKGDRRALDGGLVRQLRGTDRVLPVWAQALLLGGSNFVFGAVTLSGSVREARRGEVSVKFTCRVRRHGL